MKTHANITTTLQREAIEQFNENGKIVVDFIDRTQYSESDVLYCLIMYERNVALNVFHTNGTHNTYIKDRKISIDRLLNDVLNMEFKNYYADI